MAKPLDPKKRKTQPVPKPGLAKGDTFYIVIDPSTTRRLSEDEATEMAERLCQRNLKPYVLLVAVKVVRPQHVPVEWANLPEDEG